MIYQWSVYLLFCHPFFPNCNFAILVYSRTDLLDTKIKSVEVKISHQFCFEWRKVQIQARWHPQSQLLQSSVSSSLHSEKRPSTSGCFTSDSVNIQDWRHAQIHLYYHHTTANSYNEGPRGCNVQYTSQCESVRWTEQLSVLEIKLWISMSVCVFHGDLLWSVDLFTLVNSQIIISWEIMYYCNVWYIITMTSKFMF